jgi:sugar fermentation stimulation protein A
MSGTLKKIIYKYNEPLQIGVLKKRYKRFLADVTFNDTHDGEEIVTYCPNTGSMYMLVEPHNNEPDVACSISDNLKRKYKYTMEMVKENGSWVGIHSALANKMVENALNLGYIKELNGFSNLKREVPINYNEVIKGKIKKENCKIDFELLFGDNNNVNEDNLIKEDSFNFSQFNYKANSIIEDNKINILTNENNKKRLRDNDNIKTSFISQNILLEVKSVTLALPRSNSNEIRAEFPDCPSKRAQKHLKVLIDYIEKGKGRAAIIFLIQRDDCSSFSACYLDPDYGPLLKIAISKGVEILPYACKLNPLTGEIELLEPKLPFIDY